MLLDGGLRGHLGDLGLAFSVASAAPGGGARGFCLTHAGVAVWASRGSSLMFLPCLCGSQPKAQHAIKRPYPPPTAAAPEQVLGERCTSAADMYSYGVLLVELTTRQAVHRRGTWHLPHAPEECPQVGCGLLPL